MGEITDRDIRTQVLHSLNDDPAGYNVDGLVQVIIATYGRVDIDSIGHDEYWALVKDHATDDVDGERGHCDTCGAPCDDDGCTRDRSHAIAIDPFSTRT